MWSTMLQNYSVCRTRFPTLKQNILERVVDQILKTFRLEMDYFVHVTVLVQPTTLRGAVLRVNGKKEGVIEKCD